jgi:hypothetical protein
MALGLTTGGVLMAGLGMTTAHAAAAATASGSTADSPGIGSGNLLQIPINVPVDICGNQIGIVEILNSVAHNSCADEGGGANAAGSATGSPGAGSGNVVQIPVNAPVDICGNQVDVVGIRTSDRGNSCENTGQAAGASATGAGSHAPGIIAGNVLQVPVSAPVNVCGNQVDVVGILDRVARDSCENNTSSGPTVSPTPTPTPVPTPTGCSCPPPTPHPSDTASPPTAGRHRRTHGASLVGSETSGGSGRPSGLLAHTGTDVLSFAPLGAGLLSGGVLLRRRLQAGTAEDTPARDLKPSAKE